ncbi:hypothetical protein QQP08_021590 [Theobroma cacao]|nr:hypothetical protein QQP08_021590 [Theobroma cacao]
MGEGRTNRMTTPWAKLKYSKETSHEKTQEVGFGNTTLGLSPSFNADPGLGLAFWEARSHRAHGSAGLPAVMGMPPFPGQRLGPMRDLLHEERYRRR